MKERPILFSGPMVQAIIEGRKTQTRRAVKPQPPEGAHPFHILVSSSPRDEGKWRFTKSLDHLSGTVLGPIACPYGVPGDRLWVRETYAWSGDSSIPEADRIASGEVWYRADGGRGGGIRWRPSIFMPRWASRILLEITGVRVERLQDISEADCWAEGIDAVDGVFDESIPAMAQRMGRLCEDAAPTFACLWESINGTDSWNANPLVWVVSFRRVEAK
jgi:hypothetical protein